MSHKVTENAVVAAPNDLQSAEVLVIILAKVRLEVILTPTAASACRTTLNFLRAIYVVLSKFSHQPQYGKMNDPGAPSGTGYTSDPSYTLSGSVALTKVQAYSRYLKLLKMEGMFQEEDYFFAKVAHLPSDEFRCSARCI
eukprot:IDg4835t1